MKLNYKSYLGIGANLSILGHDNPKSGCLAALDRLALDTGLIIQEISPWYRTEPVPVSDQPWFYNAVAAVETNLSAEKLISAIHDVEAEMGRVRVHRNEARVIDIDIIDFNGQMQHQNPILPHPRMHDRAFVLYPLRDLAPDWIHPVTGRSIDALISDICEQKIKRE